MPVFEYQCKEKHITEKLFLSKVNSEPIPDKIECETCQREAKKIQSLTGKHKMEYGAAYGYATDSDRRAFIKNLNVKSFVGNPARTDGAW
jgi:hypothetical protein